MRQKLFIIFGLAALVLIMIGLNVLSYKQKETEPDTEINPNRSTFNLGSTGTRAFFQLLVESGRKAVRWQRPPGDLLTDQKNRPSTFVIVGKTRKEIRDGDAQKILQWVSEGGKLVLIDREPATGLIKSTGKWSFSFVPGSRLPDSTTDASDVVEMTRGTKAAMAVQPTLFTTGVNSVQTSAFATSISFRRVNDSNLYNSEALPSRSGGRYEPSDTPPPPKSQSGSASDSGSSSAKKATPTPRGTGLGSSDGNAGADDKRIYSTNAPVAHFAVDRRNVVVDVPYGAGRIVYVSDPFLVANSGIGLVDNLPMALKTVDAGDGIIAFNEYHQGYGINENRLLEFFAGTPVLPIFFQLCLLAIVILFSQSRRFARAVPEPEPNRLSKLEYVSAMAELQRRTKGYDLAIENIYSDFRRRVARLVGVDALRVRRQDLAHLINERVPSEDPLELERLMQRCEDVMHGDKSNNREVLKLTTRLRQIEEKLGLQRRDRRNK